MTTANSNPASLISVSANQRTDWGTLPIDPIYAAALCLAAAVIIPALVIAVKGWGESKKLRLEQATLEATRAATLAKMNTKR